MTDITITSTSVKPGLNAALDTGSAGAAVTAGQAVYRDSGAYKLTDNNLTAAEAAVGIAVSGAASGQPLVVQTSGQLSMGATLTKGAAYYASATAGGICLFADLVTGDAVILLGIAVSTSVLDLHVVNTGVTL